MTEESIFWDVYNSDVLVGVKVAPGHGLLTITPNKVIFN